MTIFKIYGNIKSCKIHIEIIPKIYKVFVNWSPAPPPHPRLGKQKLPRGNNRKKTLVGFIFFITKL